MKANILALPSLRPEKVLLQSEIWNNNQIKDMSHEQAANVLRLAAQAWPPSWFEMLRQEGFGEGKVDFDLIAQFNQISETPLGEALQARQRNTTPAEPLISKGLMPKIAENIIARAWMPGEPSTVSTALIDAERYRRILYEQNRKPGLRMSPSKALNCARKAWYELTETEPTSEKDDRGDWGMAAGTAFHSAVEDAPETWAQLTDEQQAELSDTLMGHYPDGVAEQRLSVDLGGHKWSMVIDFNSPSAGVVVDYKSRKNFPNELILKGDPPKVSDALQIGIYGVALELENGVEYTEGRVGNLPFEPLSDWHAAGLVPEGIEPKDAEFFAKDQVFNLKDPGVQGLVWEVINTGNKVLEIVENESAPPPRWWPGVPAGAKVDPRPKQKGRGSIIWINEAGKSIAEQDWHCSYCDFRDTCIKDFEKETKDES